MSQFKVGDIVRVVDGKPGFEVFLNVYGKNCKQGIWIVTEPQQISLKRPNGKQEIWYISSIQLELLVSVDWPNKRIKPIVVTPPSTEVAQAIMHVNPNAGLAEFKDNE